MAAPHLCALHAYIPGCVCLFCGRINCLTAALCSVRVRAFAQCFLWACCCRLREGQGPGDEVAELIADLVFWPFFPQLSARTALFCSLWSLVTPLRRVSFPPVFTHFPMRRLYLLIKRATPEFVHLPPRFACALARCRKRNETASNFGDGTSAPSPLCVLPSQFGARRVSVDGQHGLSACKLISNEM